MSQQKISILFVGCTETAQALSRSTASRGWLVYHTAETMEALAMHIFYYPDIVVIERVHYPITATEVAYHLGSLNDETPIFVVNSIELPVMIAQIEAALTDSFLLQF